MGGVAGAVTLLYRAATISLYNALCFHQAKNHRPFRRGACPKTAHERKMSFFLFSGVDGSVLGGIEA
ncbi:MAG: hypothetical protein ABF636_09990, partial [Acetobacter sp.]